MKKEITGWNEVPSLQGLEVDWQFEPENPLGKRVWPRIPGNDLHEIFNFKNASARESIPVKVVAKGFEETGYLMDIGQGGIAVLMDTKLNQGQLLRVGLFLGKYKLIAQVVTRNVRNVDFRFVCGMEFFELDKESKDYIAGIVSSQMWFG